MEYKTTASLNPADNSIHYDTKYKNGLLKYKKLIASNQINNSLKWSCYGDTDSTNYIELIDDQLQYFRALHVDGDQAISYTKKDMHYKDKSRDIYYRHYSEEKVRDYVRIESKKCFVKYDSKLYYVTSEKYSRE
jgi:hypothetical protein